MFMSQSARITGPARVDSPWLEAGWHDRGTGETEIAVRVLSRNLPWGKSLGRIWLRADDPTRPEFSLGVQATGVAALRAVPSHVFLRPGRSERVRFITRDGLTAGISSVIDAPDGIDACLSDGGSELIVTLNGSGSPGSGAIRVADRHGARAKVIVTAVE